MIAGSPNWPVTVLMQTILDLLRTPAAQATIWVAVLLIISVVAAYFLSKLRDRAKGDDTSTDYVSHFREMKHEGVLSEQEFRTIKTNLGAQLRGNGPSNAAQRAPDVTPE